MSLFKKYSEQGFGNRTLIANQIGVTRQAVHYFIKKHPETLTILEDDKAAFDDVCVNRVQKAVSDGNVKAAIDWLRLRSKEKEIEAGRVQQLNLVTDVGRVMTDEERDEMLRKMGVKKK